MHTDYKVGILIGVVVLAVGGAYMLVRTPEDVVTEKPVAPEEPTVTLVTDGAPTEIDLADETTDDTSSNNPLIAVEDDILIVPEDDVMAGDDVLIVTPDPAVDTVDTADVVVVGGTLMVDDPTPTIDDTLALQDDGEMVMVMDTDLDTPTGGNTVGEISENDLAVVVDPGEITPVGGVSQGGMKTYRVQKGDDGYWTIAAKVWGEGNGRHWKKIQDANPGVVSTSLVAGMVLNIPALEEGTGTTGTTAITSGAPKPGSTFINSAGQKVYVVSKDDSAGLWGVSSKVYGKGHLWRKIAQANPSAVPTKLKAGQQLVIPPHSSTSSTTGSTTGTSASNQGQTITTAGVDYYVVSKKDSAGLWGIAKKLYGHGKYHTLLQKANPNVNSNALRVGQRLVKPAKPAASPVRPSSDTGRSSRRRTPSTIATDEPDFGE
jgi:nucleoid-associated protein YgaU